MKIEGAFLIILLSMTLATVDIERVPEKECPKCDLGKNCTVFIPVKHLTIEACICSLCIKQCYDRQPICSKGTECVMEPISCIEGFKCKENDLVPSAVCKPFTACKPVPKTCQDPVKTCPESGFLKDQNNCDSCLCNDPCKELKCKVEGKCLTYSVDLDTDPTYECPAAV